MKTRIKPKESLNGNIEFVEIFDHKVIVARPAIPEVPATEDHPGNSAVPAFAGTVSSLVRCSDVNNAMMVMPFRKELTEEQYLAWTTAVVDDEQYFTDCHLANMGLEKA